MEEKIENVLEFLDKSPSAFHCTKNITDRLIECGFENGNSKTFQKGKKYFVTRNNSAVIAFTMGDVNKGFRIIAAHNDSPCPYLKPSPIVEKMGYSFFDTEIYGGATVESWVDRPLALCGRVTVKTDDIFKPAQVLINCERAIAVIPNVAIHLRKEAVGGLKYGKQKELLPLISTGKTGDIYEIISEFAHIGKEDILDFELMLYPIERACVLGIKNEFVSSARLDNLLMSYGALCAVSQADTDGGINMIYCADNEEVGSLTAQGAQSGFLRSVIEKIAGENTECVLEKSFVISADAAHGLHPSYAERYDVDNAPLVGGGVCLKYSAAKKYSTDSVSGAVFKSLCNKAGIKMQSYANHSDIGGGSTIGAMIAADLGIHIADMGVPIIGMHSARELGGVRDILDCIKLFKVFFE